MTTWRDQVALVTGGARGIGRATAQLLAQRGAAVCVNYAAQADAAEGLAAEIMAAGGRAIAAMANVAEATTVEMMVARAEKELGPVTILVNNAGISWRGTLDTFDPEQVTHMRRVNVEGLIHATRAVLGGMRARRYGRIVNISSVAAIGTALPGNAFYAASKAEVAILTKRFAMELGPYNITVNAVAPGFIRTDIDAARPRRRRLAGDGAKLRCKGYDGAHRRTRGHRQCRRVFGLTGVRLDHRTDIDRRRRANGLHRTRLEMNIELLPCGVAEMPSSDRRPVVQV